MITLKTPSEVIKGKKKTVHFVVFNCSTTTNKMTLTDKVSNPSGKTSLNTTA